MNNVFNRSSLRLSVFIIPILHLVQRIASFLYYKLKISTEVFINEIFQYLSTIHQIFLQ